MSPRTEQQNKEIRQKTRKQIMDAAFELFANEGYVKTSISAVAKKAGVSKGLIYHYFESKEAILEGIFDQLIHLGDELLDFPDDLGAKEKIGQIIDQTFLFIEHQPALGRLMISLALQPGTIQTFRSKIDEMNRNQMQIYINIFKDLGFKDAETEAYKLGAQMDGIMMGFITMGDSYPLEKLKQKLRDEYVN